MKKENFIIAIVLITGLIISDYLNIPSLLGFKKSNIDFDFWIGISNIIVIIILYIITYKKIDEKAIEREKNKYSISVLLFHECYRDCINYVELLNQETVEKHIISKIDPNSANNPIIGNIQNSPFIGENAIMDFVKDGQVTKLQIEGYFRVRQKYRQYIIMRIIFYDKPQIYEPLKTDLYNIVEYETKRFHTQI